MKITTIGFISKIIGISLFIYGTILIGIGMTIRMKTMHRCLLKKQSVKQKFVIRYFLEVLTVNL